MDRRKSLKTMLVGGLAAGVLVEACKQPNQKSGVATQPTAAQNADRTKEEIAYNQQLQQDKYFTAEEMATITILADIIIPRDEVSGSATDAKVPEFIEFIVKDMPQHQLPMRGGLRWLDVQCLNRYEKPFKNCTTQQQMEIVDEIAWPKKAKPAMQQGVAFFNLMRNLTASGFYTTEMGVKDVGYIGNGYHQWNGVPDDVLKQYGLAYSEKELTECISFEKA